MELFYWIPHVKNILLIQLIYAREFLGVAKEALQRSFPGQRTVSQGRKQSWYPPEHSIYNFRELKLFFPKWSESIKISADDLAKPWIWTNNCARAVRQRLFHQKMKMITTGRFFYIISILTNKQGDRNHSGVNQSKIIIKPTMSIQLKMTQNEKKYTLKMNNLTSFIHPVEKRRRNMS